MMKRAMGLVLFLACFPFFRADLSAAPVPPLRVVNHETKECGETFGGDECMDCFPPEGWESLGYAMSVPCPEGYTVVDNVEYTCQGFKIDRCCSEGHSGAAGDCEDLLITDKEKQCAFVDDVQSCALPEGWTSKPAATAAREWLCPAGYQWLETLSCEEPESSGKQAGSKGVGCPGAALVGTVTIGLYLQRRGRS